MPALVSRGHRWRWLALGLAAVAVSLLIPRATRSAGRVTLESWSAGPGWVRLAAPTALEARPAWSRDSGQGRVVVRGNGVFALSTGSRTATVTAFDLVAGQTRWVTPLPVAPAVGSPPRLLASGRLLAVASAGRLVALLDGASGRTVWTGGPATARVADGFVVGGMAVLSTAGGLVGLDERSGTRRWVLAGASDPLVAEGDLFAQLDRAGHTDVARLDPATGRPAYTVPTGGAPPRVVDGLLVLSGPYGLAAFRARDGVPLWSLPAHPGTDAGPAGRVSVTPVSRAALAVADDRSVRVVDARTGALRYTRPERNWVRDASPLRTGRRNLVFGRHGDELRLLDGDDGTRVAAARGVAAVLAVSSGAIWVWRDGRVTALHPGNLAVLWAIDGLPGDVRLVPVDSALVAVAGSRITVYR